MAWTQSDLDALEIKLKAAVRSASKGDRSVTYASIEEILKLRDTMKAVVNVAAGINTRCTYAKFQKG